MKKTFAAAALLVALVPAAAFAQSLEPVRTDVQANPILKLNLTSVKGTIALSGSHMLVVPGAGDACSNITVSAYQIFQDGLAQTTKNVVPSVKATGNITTKSCSYAFLSVPAGKSIYIGAFYTGPLANQADSNGGTNGPFTPQAGQSYTKNLNLVFTQLQ